MFYDHRVIGAMQNFGYVIGDPETKTAAVALAPLRRSAEPEHEVPCHGLRVE